MIPHRFSYQGAASGQMVSLVAPPLSNGTYKDSLGSCQVGHPSQILENYGHSGNAAESYDMSCAPFKMYSFEELAATY